MLTDDERLKLNDLIAEHNPGDQTEKIRKLKHSTLIRDDVTRYIELKKKYPNSLGNKFFKEKVYKDCNFLYNHYTDIFNKLIKDELNLSILGQFLDVLSEIEDGKLDQHEGSVKVGRLLKELYIDSAMRQGEKIDKREKRQEANRKAKEMKDPNHRRIKNMSYKDFKIEMLKKMYIERKIVELEKTKKNA